MTRICYKDILEKVVPGCFINFVEYGTDMVGHHTQQVIVEDAPVVAVVPAEQELGRDTIEAYLNGPVTDEYAMTQHQVGYHRIIVQVDTVHGVEHKILGLVEAYMLMNLQQLWVKEAPQQVEFPAIGQPDTTMSGPVKGFSDYQVGAGLYRNFQKNISQTT